MFEDKHKLTTAEYAQATVRFGSDRGCSIGRDKNGYFAYTHRARSKSYPSIDKIPMKDYKFICSTS